MAQKSGGRGWLSFVALIVVLTVVSLLWMAPKTQRTNDVQAVQPVQSAEAAAVQAPTQNTVPVMAPALPAQEMQFVSLIQSFAARYQAAANDMARGALRRQRAHAFCDMGRRGVLTMTQPWIGAVTELSSNSDGRGILKIQIADGITVSTTNNAFSDSLASIKTLIDPDSHLGQAASALKEGQTVRFTAVFGRTDADCLDTKTITQQGAMTEPDFLVKFKTVQPAG